MKKSFVPPLLFTFAATFSFLGFSEPINAALQPGTVNESPFNLDKKGIPNPNRERNQIVCISDIHLGMDTTYAECKHNRASLVNFLKQVRSAPKVKELVIAGDLLDEWFIPAKVETFNSGTQRDFVKTIANSNKEVIAAFNRIIEERKVKVTYVPGNHDLLITAEDVLSILPGIAQARDTKGLGSYSPAGHPEIVIEHGHRYNFFCAPDPFSNQTIARGSILPPGYFFTRIATQSVIEGKPAPGGVLPKITEGKPPLIYEYWKQWYSLMTSLPVREGLNEKIITTNIDGYKANYSINDLVPFQLKNGILDVELFKGSTADNIWAERQRHNKVAVKITAMTAIKRANYSEETDDQANIQYFTNPRSLKRIVVFGHTHDAKIIPSRNLKGEKTIYANSGTWIDGKKDNESIPIMTFVVVTPEKSGVATENVNLYRYWTNGGITRLATEALTKLKK
ncbi:MAG: metallophosphoesterase [Chlorobiaceae bacterium]|nr:metallophosphoesterase [Chlorobiaceae bacterium]